MTDPTIFPPETIPILLAMGVCALVVKIAIIMTIVTLISNAVRRDR